MQLWTNLTVQPVFHKEREEKTPGGIGE